MSMQIMRSTAFGPRHCSWFQCNLSENCERHAMYSGLLFSTPFLESLLACSDNSGGG